MFAVVKMHSYWFVQHGCFVWTLTHLKAAKGLVHSDASNRQEILSTRKAIYPQSAIGRAVWSVAVTKKTNAKEDSIYDFNAFCCAASYRPATADHWYASKIWNPSVLMYISDLENVQRNFTHLIRFIKHLSYPDRPVGLILEPLEFRSLRADLLM